MINIRSAREIDAIRKACQAVGEILDFAETLIAEGVSTQVIDRELEQMTIAKGGIPAFKGYGGFPASACISVEDVVVHGIPGERILERGEIVGVDYGVQLDGYFGDSARTFAVGDISLEKKRLMDVTRAALAAGIEQARPGNRLSDISHAVQTVVEKAGFSVVRDLVGHGIGTHLHEDPQIPNYGLPGHGPRLKAGMVFAIEPMVNMGTYEVYTDEDEWAVLTDDGQPSAHFEHTIVITDNGPEILTLADKSDLE